MTERATTIGVPEPSAARISTIAGSDRPEAAGHRFGPDLTCIECGKTWDDHQIDPTVCTPSHGSGMQYASHLDDAL